MHLIEWRQGWFLADWKKPYIENDYQLDDDKKTILKVFVATDCGPPPKTFNTSGHAQKGYNSSVRGILYFGFIPLEGDEQTKRIFFVIHPKGWRPYQHRFVLSSITKFVHKTAKVTVKATSAAINTLAPGAISRASDAVGRAQEELNDISATVGDVRNEFGDLTKDAGEIVNAAAPVASQVAPETSAKVNSAFTKGGEVIDMATDGELVTNMVEMVRGKVGENGQAILPAMMGHYLRYIGSGLSPSKNKIANFD